MSCSNFKQPELLKSRAARPALLSLVEHLTQGLSAVNSVEGKMERRDENREGGRREEAREERREERKEERGGGTERGSKGGGEELREGRANKSEILSGFRKLRSVVQIGELFL